MEKDINYYLSKLDDLEVANLYLKVLDIVIAPNPEKLGKRRAFQTLTIITFVDKTGLMKDRLLEKLQNIEEKTSDPSKFSSLKNMEIILHSLFYQIFYIFFEIALNKQSHA